jgi:hypothetical protein
LKLHELLALAMEGKGSLVIDIMGDALKGPLPEDSMASSSFDASSSGAASDVAETEAEASMDPCELMQSYVFRASSITVGCIRQCEPREEIMLEPNYDEAVGFEEFFTVGF